MPVLQVVVYDMQNISLEISTDGVLIMPKRLQHSYGPQHQATAADIGRPRSTETCVSSVSNIDSLFLLRYTYTGTYRPLCLDMSDLQLTLKVCLCQPCLCTYHWHDFDYRETGLLVLNDIGRCVFFEI